MTPEVFFINIKPENWPACDRDKIFGTPVDTPHHPVLTPGDLFLVRRAWTRPCGCVGIWEFIQEEPVTATTALPWPDAVQNRGPVRYALIQRCREVCKFAAPFVEGFEGVGGNNPALGLHAQHFRGAIAWLERDAQARYLRALLEEKGDELICCCPECFNALKGQTRL